MFKGLLAGIGILILILDSGTALAGAQDGIALCLQSVIPSIFPFLVLTGVLLPYLVGKPRAILRPVSRLLGIPPGTEGIFFAGLLGGYPTGALMVTQAWKSGRISRGNAERMLAFCSNAGPSFLFGILAARYPSIWMLWALWGIHIISAILVAAVMPGKAGNDAPAVGFSPMTWSDSLKNAVKTMGCICGWVIFFRVMLAFLDRWVLWLLPITARIAVHGILELANGCCSLEQVPTVGLRFVICSGMLAFGGICVLLQTSSVTDKLSLRYHLAGKLLQTVFSILFSLLSQQLIFCSEDKLDISFLLPAFLSVTLIFFAFLGVKLKFRGRNPVKIGV